MFRFNYLTTTQTTLLTGLYTGVVLLDCQKLNTAK